MTGATVEQNRPIVSGMDFDVQTVRADFPALHTRVYDRPLVYLDNAATSQKPRAVIERITTYYEQENSNIHRGVHFLSQQATDAYEQARLTVARFIHASDPRQVIFTRGTTEAINLVAATFGRSEVAEGDEIVITTLEHHSNIVPWQLLCESVKANLRVVPIDERGRISFDAYQRSLTDRTKLVAVSHVSNALGTVNPVGEMVRIAHERGIPVLLDGAQAVPHMPVDVQELGCDFYCFSGHKMFGPTGIGVLYGREDLLERMPPYQGGGDMIETVSFDGTTFNTLPYKFEAGTPNIAGALGLEAAIEYMNAVGIEAIHRYEKDLLAYATEEASRIEGLRIIGTAEEKASVLSFELQGIHPYDAGAILDRLGIAVRTGHHCTQPLMACLGLPGTIRASFAFYNTMEEVDALMEGIRRVQRMLS